MSYVFTSVTNFGAPTPIYFWFVMTKVMRFCTFNDFMVSKVKCFCTFLDLMVPKPVAFVQFASSWCTKSFFLHTIWYHDAQNLIFLHSLASAHSPIQMKHTSVGKQKTLENKKQKKRWKTKKHTNFGKQVGIHSTKHQKIMQKSPGHLSKTIRKTMQNSCKNHAKTIRNIMQTSCKKSLQSSNACVFHWDWGLGRATPRVRPHDAARMFLCRGWEGVVGGGRTDPLHNAGLPLAHGHPPAPQCELRGVSACFPTGGPSGGRRQAVATDARRSNPEPSKRLQLGAPGVLPRGLPGSGHSPGAPCGMLPAAPGGLPSPRLHAAICRNVQARRRAGGGGWHRDLN